MNQITRKNAIELGLDFNELISDFVENSYQEHRIGANFFTKSIIEINEKWYPNIDRKFDGYWETNTYIWDDNSGPEKDEITELNRVELKEKVVKTKYYELIN